MWDEPISVASASTLAQIIPALLVAGLLGPLLSHRGIEWPERFYYASSVFFSLMAEGVLVWFIMRNEEVPAGLGFAVSFGILQALLGVGVFPFVWARKTREEKAKLAREKADVATRREHKRAERARVNAEKTGRVLRSDETEGVETGRRSATESRQDELE